MIKIRMYALLIAGALLASCAASPGRAEAGAAPTISAEAVSGIEALMGDLRVREAFTRIDRTHERDLDTMIRLNEIPAPTFQEGPRAAAFADLLRDAGLTAAIDDAGNVIGRFEGGGDGPVVAFVAHLDTVFSAETDVTVRREGNIFTAPGVADNTRGLVMLVSMADALVSSGLRTDGDILFIGSAAEEGIGNLKGVRHIYETGTPRIDVFIAVDGNAPTDIVYAAVGSNRYRVTFRGPGGHSYNHFGRGHPHHALAAAIAGFVERARPITREDGAQATFSVGRIGGGASINSIPSESWFEVDLRSIDKDKLARLDSALKTAVDLAAKDENAQRASDDPVSVQIETVGVRPGGKGDPSGSLVQNAMAATGAFGVTPRLTAASTDANIPISLGRPAIVVSRGGVASNIHSLSEYWEDRETQRAEKIALLIALAEAGLAAADPSE